MANEKRIKFVISGESTTYYNKNARKWLMQKMEDYFTVVDSVHVLKTQLKADWGITLSSAISNTAIANPLYFSFHLYSQTLKKIEANEGYKLSQFIIKIPPNSNSNSDNDSGNNVVGKRNVDIRQESNDFEELMKQASIAQSQLMDTILNYKKETQNYNVEITRTKENIETKSKCIEYTVSYNKTEINYLGKEKIISKKEIIYDPGVKSKDRAFGKANYKYKDKDKSSEE